MAIDPPDSPWRYGGKLVFLMKMGPTVPDASVVLCKPAYGGNVYLYYSLDEGDSWETLEILETFSFRNDNFTEVGGRCALSASPLSPEDKIAFQFGHCVRKTMFCGPDSFHLGASPYSRLDPQQSKSITRASRTEQIIKFTCCNVVRWMKKKRRRPSAAVSSGLP